MIFFIDSEAILGGFSSHLGPQILQNRDQNHMQNPNKKTSKNDAKKDTKNEPKSIKNGALGAQRVIFGAPGPTLGDCKKR